MIKLPKHLKGPFTNAYYNTQDNRLYLKNTNGKYSSVVTLPCFFILKKDINDFPFKRYNKNIINTKLEGDYYKISRSNYMRNTDLIEMIEYCESKNIKVFEADVRPVRRWFSDTGALVSDTYRNLYFDLETHPLIQGFDDEAKLYHRIISFSAYDEEGNSWFHAANNSSDEEEVKVIKKFLKIAEDYDTLLAWNGDKYDFFVLKGRCGLNKLKVNWYKWNLLDQMLLTKKIVNVTSDTNFKRSFSLDTVGESILNIRKLKLSVKPGEMYKLLGERVNELEQYNRRDVEIMLKLEEKKEYVKFHYAICSLCRTFPNSSSVYPTERTDGILLRLAAKEGIHFKTKQFGMPSNKKYEGAYVMKPKIGFHENVQVPDFASLYPSIIISWNMSNETIISENNCNMSSFDRSFASATGVYFDNTYEGIIPKALKKLMTQRKKYKEEADTYDVGSAKWKSMNNLSTATKVAANSIYGLLGTTNSRYYDVDIARSVTLSAQLLIRKVIEFFENKSYDAIYADTDSVFIKSSIDDMEKELVIINNEFIPSILDEYNCREKAIKMDFDKGFKTLLLLNKKRYCGKLALSKGRTAPETMSPDVKGIELQRSDQVRFLQKMLTVFIDMLLLTEVTPEDVESELMGWGEVFFNTDMKREDIEIYESVSREPDEYKIKTPAVKVAENLIKQDKEFFVGMKIPYIIMSDDPVIYAIHADDYTNVFDKKHYWRKKILPPVLRLVETRFPDYSFQDFENPKQLSFDFYSKKDKTNMKKIRKVKDIDVKKK